MIEQEKPENQDPGVAYVLDETTGETSPLPGGPLDVREKAVVKPRGRKPKAPETTEIAEAPAEDDVASLAELGTQED